MCQEDCRADLPEENAAGTHPSTPEAEPTCVLHGSRVARVGTRRA